jgi:hypothetical protein
MIGQIAPVRIESFNLSQHVYLIQDRKALHTPAVGAWWKYVATVVASRETTPVQEELNEPEREEQRRVAERTRTKSSLVGAANSQ